MGKWVGLDKNTSLALLRQFCPTFNPDNEIIVSVLMSPDLSFYYFTTNGNLRSIDANTLQDTLIATFNPPDDIVVGGAVILKPVELICYLINSTTDIFYFVKTDSFRGKQYFIWRIKNGESTYHRIDTLAINADYIITSVLYGLLAFSDRDNNFKDGYFLNSESGEHLDSVEYSFDSNIKTIIGASENGFYDADNPENIIKFVYNLVYTDSNNKINYSIRGLENISDKNDLLFSIIPGGTFESIEYNPSVYKYTIGFSTLCDSSFVQTNIEDGSSKLYTKNSTIEYMYPVTNADGSINKNYLCFDLSNYGLTTLLATSYDAEDEATTFMLYQYVEDDTPYIDSLFVNLKFSNSENPIMSQALNDIHFPISKIKINTVKNYQVTIIGADGWMMPIITFGDENIKFVDKYIIDGNQYEAPTDAQDFVELPFEANRCSINITFNVGATARHLIEFVSDKSGTAQSYGTYRVIDGEVPIYKGEEPKKEGYKFVGWEPELYSANKDQVYVAKFEKNETPITLGNFISKDGVTTPFTSIKFINKEGVEIDITDYNFIAKG